MVVNGNVPCNLQQSKCPDQNLWAPLYIFSQPTRLCRCARVVSNLAKQHQYQAFIMSKQSDELVNKHAILLGKEESH